MGLTARRIVVLIINLASGVLTLLTGLRENPLIVLVTGRYDAIRARLRENRINYQLVRDDLLDVDTLLDLKHVADSFRFISAPTRSPANLGEDRSTCMRVKGINVTDVAMYYDDFWGYGARRAQHYFHSISAPRCDIINFKTEWFGDCVTSHGNSTGDCHRYILDEYDKLKTNRVIQSGKQNDAGEDGVPFLRCVGRPPANFTYFTDLLVFQQFWAGGSYHLELQMSRCRAVPRVINADKYYGLFQTEPVDQAAEVKVAIDNTGWLSSIVIYAYGIVTLLMIARGIFNTVVQLREVTYVPLALRFAGLRKYVQYLFPFMAVSTIAADHDTVIVAFKGNVILASDAWINHWLYITLSILDALVSIRATYTVYEMGQWMLSMQISFDNFVFMASALTRLTWLMCLVHTVIRLLLKLGARSLKALKLVSADTRDKIDWFADASALFVSYKVYSLMLCALLYFFIKVHGGTSFMVSAPNNSRGVFGGAPEITGFWQNEIMCDFTIIMCCLTLGGFVFSSIMLLTPYRAATHNRLLRLIQQRYIFVGWDPMTTMEALGIDPFNTELTKNGVAATNCSLGAVIQQMYQSGPSGSFALAADTFFYHGGFAAGPMVLKYPRKRAVRIGLIAGGTAASKVSQGAAAYYVKSTDASNARHVDKSNKGDDHHGDIADLPGASSTSLFERDLHLVAETTYGRVMLVDEDCPGKYVKNEHGALEYAVTDALSTMQILDVKHLLGNTKKLHFR